MKFQTPINGVRTMKRKISIVFLMLAAVFSLLVESAAKESVKSEKKSTFNKAGGTPTATLININRMAAWYESNGQQEREPATGNSGVTYPRGTSTVIYAAGLMWGGKVNDGITPVIRVNGQSYSVGTVPGAILGIRTGIIEDPTQKEVRIWRIRKDYATADLKQDAAEFFVKALGSVSDGDIEQIRTQYKLDWSVWPWQKGAPFYDTGYFNATGQKINANNGILDWGEDLNKNGILDVGEDVNENKILDAESPGAADADQLLWYVANDIGGTSPWASPDIGLEMQTTIWGYNRSDALGNMIFKKFKLIYKGTVATPANATITDMFLTQWSDPDLGDAGDDFAGCDTLLSLGYVYNSKTLDKEYKKFDIAPPASGYDFFQGPIVVNPADTAVWNLKLRPGYSNLPMTSFIYFVAGGVYGDPPFSANGAVQGYNMMNGFPPPPQGPPMPPPFINPVTNVATSFWLSGDPVQKTGWYDGISEPAADRRFLLTSGPFNMAVGDTQELVTALIAGLGADRLSSVSVLKFYDKTAQAAYDNLFVLPKPPPQPKATAIPLNKGVILEWEKNVDGVKATEGSNSKGYVFEGYNVWQLPSVTSPLSNAKRLKTYDLITDPSTVSQEEFAEASGQILVTPVQLGTNSGLTRYLYVTTDAIRNKPFVNGQRYYFAVTAYNYNGDPLLTTKSFESSPVIIEVIPQEPNPGVVLPYKVNDTLTVPSSLVVGENDANVGVVIFNPTLQKGNTFDVWYGGDGTARNYTIVKTIGGSTDYATVTAALKATNSVPAINNLPNAKGTGTFTINDAKTQVNYKVTVEGLTGAITAAHIHTGAKGKTGVPVHTLTFTGNTSEGTWTIPDSLVSPFTAGNLYANVHTAANPNGEIRGQISDGMFERTALAPAQTPLPKLTTYTDHRFPAEGLSFFVGPAPKGAKSAIQTAPSTGNVVNVPNPEKTYSMIGPSSAWAGAKDVETNYEIRFVSGVNWAVTVPGGVSTPVPPDAKFIRVPFAVYQDTTRVWPAIVNTTNTDTLWNADEKNVTVNNKPTFDMILGIVDVRDGSNNNLTYYSPSFPSFPPNTNLWKGRLINGVNHTLKNITFVSEKGDGSYPVPGTTIKLTANKSVKIGDIRRFTLNAYQSFNQASAKTEVNRVNVFPNPYYGVNTSERTRELRFVTFNHLPQKASIRIFNLAGVLVKVIEKDTPSQFHDWDLTNHKGLPVASGIYIVHIDMGALGTKILKSAIIMEQQFLQNY